MPDFYSHSPQFQIRKCTNPACHLRFSIILGDPRGEHCPLCRSETAVVSTTYDRYAVENQADLANGPELEVLLDNIRSAWNVGSMLRSADGAGVRKIHLCGVSSTPDNPKVWKTALGAERSLPWQFSPDGVELALALKDQGLRLWALEGGPRAESLFDSVDGTGSPIVLVVGNELSGVDPQILELCERVVSLPMQGVKGSLNVAVAFGIAVYYIRYGMGRKNGQ
jgi:23S rRNA (guanosine2251-2'-O)-methyltransferase